MTTLNTFIRSSYSGGENSSTSDRLINDTECSSIRNFDITVPGMATVRMGTVAIASLPTTEEIPGETQALFSYNDGTHTCLFGVREQKAYYYNVTTGWVDITGAATLADEKLSLCNNPVDGKLYFIGKSTRLHCWHYGDAAITQGADIYGGHIRAYKTYLLVCDNVKLTTGGTVYTSRIHISAQGAATFASTDYIEITGEGGLIGTEVLGDSLSLLKSNSTSFLTGYGLDSWTVTASSNNNANPDESVGCSAPQGYKKVGNEVWFVDNQGMTRRLYQTQYDTFRRDVVSGNVSQYFTILSQAQLSKTVMETYSSKVFIAIPADASSVDNTLILVYDLLAAKTNSSGEAWVGYTGYGISPKIFCVHDDGSNVRLYFVNADEEIIYFGGSTGDQNNDIEACIEGKRNNYKRPDLFKRWINGHITGKTSTGADLIELYISFGGRQYVKLNKELDLEGVGSVLNGTDTLDVNFKIADEAEKEITFYYDNTFYANSTDKSSKIKLCYQGKNRPTVYGFEEHFITRPLRKI